MEKHNRRVSEVVVARDLVELSRIAADLFVQVVRDSVAARGRAVVALSGGSTPKALFRLLASDEYRVQVNWDRLLFFFGDERNVPAESQESNYRTANENLFLPLKLSTENIYRWKTELGDASAVAEDYEEAIGSVFADVFPVFDLVFLGMGGDGHTASLFPGTLGLDEKIRVAIANDVPQLATTRFTLTFPVINSAKNVAFLVAGADKAAALERVLEGDSDFHELPSRAVRPRPGNLYWYLDAAAAQGLSS